MLSMMSAQFDLSNPRDEARRSYGSGSETNGAPLKPGQCPIKQGQMGRQFASNRRSLRKTAPVAPSSQTGGLQHLRWL
jgi:hypothetical protein